MGGQRRRGGQDPGRSRHALNSLARGTALVATARGATIAANAVASIALARILGPDGMGGFAVALALYSILMLLAGLGLGAGTAWQVGAGVWTAESANRSTRSASVLIGLGAACIGFAAFMAGNDTIFDRVPLIGQLAVVVSVPVALVWSHAANVSVAAERYELGLRIPVGQAGVYIGGTAALALVAGVGGALAGLLLSHVVASALAALWTRRAFGASRHIAVDWDRLRRALSFGAAVWVAQLLAVAVQRSDLFVLGATAPSEEVGHYAVAVAITTPLSLLPTGLAAVLLPRVAALVAAGGGSGSRLEARAVRHTVLVLGIGALMITAAIAALPLIYGTAFRSSVTPALVLLPGTFGLGLAHVSTALLAGRGEPRKALWTWIPVVPIAAVLYATLIPAGGSTGAALASSISYGLAAALGIWLVARGSSGTGLAALKPGRSELAEWRRLARRGWR